MWKPEGGRSAQRDQLLAQRLQMLLPCLDQTETLLDRSGQEERLGHRGRDLLVPEVLHVLALVGEDLVADVVPGELLRLTGRGPERPRTSAPPAPRPGPGRWPESEARSAETSPSSEASAPAA